MDNVIYWVCVGLAVLFFQLVGVGILLWEKRLVRLEHARVEERNRWLALTPCPSHDELESIFEGLFAGELSALLPHVLRVGESSWATRLMTNAHAWSHVLLTLAGEDDFPEELPAEARVRWALSRASRARALGLALTELSTTPDLEALATEGLRHPDSRKASHEYLSQWLSSAIANVELEQVRDSKDSVLEQAVVFDFDGSLELVEDTTSGRLTEHVGRGALSSLETRRELSSRDS